MNTGNKIRKTRSIGRLQIWLIGLVFLAPVVGVFFWKPTGYVNYGELIEPARTIKDVALTRLDGTPIRFSDLHQKWTLLYVGGRLCDDVCVQSLHKIHQVRLAQSKHAYRVQSVYLIPNSNQIPQIQELVNRYSGIIGIAADETVFTELAKQFEVNKQTPMDGAQRIYIVDPLGNLMMSYPHDADPSGIRKDLHRLLKVSQIG